MIRFSALIRLLTLAFVVFFYQRRPKSRSTSDADQLKLDVSGDTGEDDDLHVLITAEKEASIERAVELLEALISPESLAASGAQRDPSVPAMPLRTTQISVRLALLRQARPHCAA